MDVRIGVTYTAKEIDIELPDDADRDEIKATIDEALGDDDRVLWLTDRNGRDVAVPSSKVAYVEIISPDADRRIGFSN